MNLLVAFFIFSSHTFAEVKISQLMIRGRIPASTSVEWDNSDENKDPKIKFKGYRVNPKVEISREKNTRRVIIFHP